MEYHVIADQALDNEIYQIKLNFPNSGEVMTAGHLPGQRQQDSQILVPYLHLAH